MSDAEADRAEVRTMLIDALGYITVWGIIDGVLSLMGCLAEKGRGLMILRAVRNAADPLQERRQIADGCVERRPWLIGIGMVVLGVVLVGLTMAPAG